MAKLFGTDGVRGVANTELTCDIAFKLGQAAVEFLGKTIVVGKDTRLSGDMLGNALSAGIMSMGGNVLDAGIIPTPGVAYLVRELHAEGGIVISASSTSIDRASSSPMKPKLRSNHSFWQAVQILRAFLRAMRWV